MFSVQIETLPKPQKRFNARHSMRAHDQMTACAHDICHISVFKFTHSGERFQIVPFSLLEKHRFSLDGRPNRMKKKRFQMYSDQCGRGLKQKKKMNEPKNNHFLFHFPCIQWRYILLTSVENDVIIINIEIFRQFTPCPRILIVILRLSGTREFYKKDTGAGSRLSSPICSVFQSLALLAVETLANKLFVNGKITAS